MKIGAHSPSTPPVDSASEAVATELSAQTIEIDHSINHANTDGPIYVNLIDVTNSSVTDIGVTSMACSHSAQVMSLSTLAANKVKENEIQALNQLLLVCDDYLRQHQQNNHSPVRHPGFPRHADNFGHPKRV